MITVKQYADERGISIQAVHQSMNGKQKKEKLKGHVYIKDGIKWLDDEAVVILDKDRRKSAYLIERAESSEEIEMLKQQVEQLLIKTATQADKISELSEWKADHAVAIAEANQQHLLLEEKLKQVEQLETSLDKSKNETKEAETKLLQEKQRVEQLQADLEQERNAKERYKAEVEAEKSKTFLQRLFNR